jgi:hypothetical protein
LASLDLLGKEFTAIKAVMVLATSRQQFRNSDPKNERDRVVTPEEWEAIRKHAAPHLARFMTVAYTLGPRRGELMCLEWPDVNMKQKEFTFERPRTVRFEQYQ